MSITAADFQRFNPVRSPWWRIARIRQLYEHCPPRRPFRTCDDKWVREGYRLLRPPSRSGNNVQEWRDRLRRTNRGLYQALEIFFHEDRDWRDMLEANILAGSTNKAIAKKMSIFPETALWFERLFYNVRDRLGCPWYIVTMIRRRSGRRTVNREGSITRFQKSVVIKESAYHGGPHVLDLMLTGFSNVSRPKSPEDARQSAGEWLKTALARKGLFAISALDADQPDAVGPLKLALKSIYERQRLIATAPSTLAIERNIEVTCADRRSNGAQL